MYTFLLKSITQFFRKTALILCIRIGFFTYNTVGSKPFAEISNGDIAACFRVNTVGVPADAPRHFW